ncbi:MAG TPA: methyl-accepting chemotaxis protein [Dongiaceae bacterium]|nr:methyl-accepting chemotaxis protein [Dongiaceae bacterium]
MKSTTNNVSLRTKLLLLPLVFLGGLIALQTSNWYVNRQIREQVMFTGFENQIMLGSSNVLKSTVDIEAQTLAARLKPLHTRDEQIAAIIAETDPVRFFGDNSGYFFTYDTKGVRINVPINKSGNGKNMMDLKDQKGFAFIQALIQTAQSGGGFVRYYFEKEGKGVQPKLSYATLIPGTDIVIGTGMYIDNVQQELATLQASAVAQGRKYLALTVGLFLVILLISGGLSAWLAESTSRAVRLVAKQLALGADQTTASAGQVSSSSQSLAEGASEQAASIEETSASLEELSSMTQRNADNARQVNDLAKQARVAADKGVADMQGMSAAMDAIKASSDDIAKIVKTIDEIAFQTNILALNAAVEAARAGEAGMGFAVVADEVRNLAQRSAHAAKETAAKIEGAITRATQGVELNAKVAAGLNEIVTKSRQVDDLAAEVANASREQTQGITQINTAVSQMDKVTQSNAASAEESAAAAEELNAQAEIMKQSVNELLRMVNGAKAEPSAGPAGGGTRPKTPAPLPAAPRPVISAAANGHGHAVAAPAAIPSAKRQANLIPMDGDFTDF